VDEGAGRLMLEAQHRAQLLAARRVAVVHPADAPDR
jgi:hypothetical protein